MSRNSNPWTALSVTLILGTAGAICVTAQTQAENSSTSTATTASSTITLTAREGKTVDTVPASVTSAPTTSPETPVPQTVDPDKWQFQFSPYFWLAGLHGTG